TWGGTSWSTSGSNTLAAVTPTAVHIDATFYGEFVITWDNSANNHIFVKAGETIAGNPPGFHSTVDVTSSTLPNQYGTYPDIAVHHDQGGNDIVDLVWLDVSSGYIGAGEETRTNVVSGTWGAIKHTTAYTAAASHVVYAPRIADASDYYQGGSGWDNTKDMTIAFEDKKSGSSDDIVGLSGAISSWTQNIFTDGVALGLGQINGYLNYSPAVTYDQVNGSAIVSWISSYNDPVFIPSAACALELDGPWAGSPYALAAPCSLFMVVPQSNSGGELPIALAGKHGKSDPFYCWYDNNATLNFSTYKPVPTGGGALRQAFKSSGNLMDVYPNPFTDQLYISIKNADIKENEIVQLTVADNEGRILFRKETQYCELNKTLNGFVGNLSSGAYILGVSKTDKNSFIHWQVVKI
ncbi:MAG: T9SS type A sorting domain-containing protein, partial [Bacteroidota bacterium]